MTAKEYIDNQKFIKSEPITLLGDNDVIYLLEEFARIKCKEQRELCAQKYRNRTDADHHPLVIENSIRNAPEPEI